MAMRHLYAIPVLLFTLHFDISWMNLYKKYKKSVWINVICCFVPLQDLKRREDAVATGKL